MIKKIVILLLGIIELLVFTGCVSTNNIQNGENNEVTQINIQKVDEPDEVYISGQIELTNGTLLEKNKARELGLEGLLPANISLKDFDEQILLGYNQFLDNDEKNQLFSDGIVIHDSDIIFVTTRYQGKIYDNLKIGSNVEDIVAVFGEPVSRVDNISFYKGADVYFAVRGKEQVQQVIIKRILKDQVDEEILLKLLAAVNESDEPLEQIILSTWNLRKIFDVMKYTYRGFYAASDIGIEIVDYEDENKITIFNNFDGKLYQILENKGNYNISFENLDYHVEQLLHILKSYTEIEEDLEEYGEVSSDGKRIFLFESDDEENTFFRIRHTDYSERDMKLATLSEVLEAEWLINDFILYIDEIHQIPLIVSVEAEPVTINVLYAIGLLDKVDILLSDGYLCKIVSVGSDVIVLENTFSNTTIYIRYGLDDKGELQIEIMTPIVQNY